MEEEIAKFMLRVAKFEFYLMNRESALRHLKIKNSLSILTGVNWTILAQMLEKTQPFATIAFEIEPFGMFQRTSPQYLTMRADGSLQWDCDNEKIECWDRLLNRSFAQLRNNIAHGNKAQLPAPFTHNRTRDFVQAGHALIDFIAQHVFDDAYWESPIIFR